MDDPFSLFEALRIGDVAAVLRAVDARPQLASSRDDAGVSLLMNALYHRRLDLAQAVLARLSSLDAFEVAALGRLGDLAAALGRAPGLISARSPDGFTLLHLAAFFAHPDVVEWLLRQGAPVDAVAANPSLVRPLHSAIAAGSFRVARQLLDAGADPNASQRGGWTPLHGAAKRGDLELVDLLVKRGADVATTAEDGRRAIDLAREQGHAHVVEHLS
ncbi:MAG: ankyrin repeat domain-containing protein [Planctomycetes bacterium]|nr:ankyrin repeat domain-containing protein [Planctomycetota bacterium]